MKSKTWTLFRIARDEAVREMRAENMSDATIRATLDPLDGSTLAGTPAAPDEATARRDGQVTERHVVNGSVESPTGEMVEIVLEAEAPALFRVRVREAYLIRFVSASAFLDRGQLVMLHDIIGRVLQAVPA